MRLTAVITAERERDGTTGEPPQRRRSERRSLKLSAVTTPPCAGEIPVVIRDISVDGLLMEAEPDVLSTDDCVEIGLPEGGSARARIAWQSGRFFGCQFSEPISASAISAALLKSAPEAAEDDPAPAPDAGVPSGSSDPKLGPELNFSIALILSLTFWALAGALVYFFFFA